MATYFCNHCKAIRDSEFVPISWEGNRIICDTCKHKGELMSIKELLEYFKKYGVLELKQSPGKEWTAYFSFDKIERHVHSAHNCPTLRAALDDLHVDVERYIQELRNFVKERK